MTPQIAFSGTGRIPIKLITLLGCLLAIAVLFSTVGRASANPAPVSDPDLLHQRHPVSGQVAPEQDATLDSLSVTASSEPVALVPQFDPATTLYTATVDVGIVLVSAAAATAGAGIDQASIADDTTDLDPAASDVSTLADLTEGTTTVVSLRVRAADQVTTETYHVILSVPADPAVPDITIEASHTEYVAGIGPLIFTLTRDGDLADSLDVSVNLIQSEEWLSTLSATATFAAGHSQATVAIQPGEFSSDVIRSGNLAATVAPVAGYDTSGAAPVRVISQEGPAVTVMLEHSTYTVDEGAGTLDVVLVARAHSSVTRVDGFNVSVSTADQTASSDQDSRDFDSVSFHPRLNSSDFQMEDGALVGRKTVTLTIVDDYTYEGDETFHLQLGRPPGLSSEVKILDPEGEECTTECPNPYAVTITERELTADMGRPGISVPACESNGIFIFWHVAIDFGDSPPPYGWRVERRHRGDGAWNATHFDFLGAESVALQTYSDEYWDWTDRTRRWRVDYSYRVHALNNDGELMEERTWSRRAPALCP